jgi:hypothetical protein
MAVPFRLLLSLYVLIIPPFQSRKVASGIDCPPLLKPNRGKEDCKTSEEVTRVCSVPLVFERDLNHAVEAQSIGLNRDGKRPDGSNDKEFNLCFSPQNPANGPECGSCLECKNHLW